MAKRLAVLHSCYRDPQPASLLAQTVAPPTTDVPVARVVLFSSGVGYFEHAGTVRGNGATELRFKTSQINDILKSIVLQDQDGGRVGDDHAIRRRIRSPRRSRAFRSTSRRIRAWRDLLNQLRGARVTVQSQAERLTGTILGVEISRQAGGTRRDGRDGRC